MTTSAERTAAAREASALARRAAAEVLRAVATETIGVVSLLTEDSPPLVAMRQAIRRTHVQRLLRAVPGVGAHIAMEVCRDADIDRLTRLESLSAGRRLVLADAITQRVDLDHGYRGDGPRRRSA